MIYKYKIFPLLFILLVAVFFRLYLLDSVPPSPSLDEVSIGYNAYSIIRTGADEYGIKFPMLLRAYDDWRPAMHVYLSIPFVAILGLSTLAVRLPSAILSILTVLATYFLVKELFSINSKYQTLNPKQTKRPNNQNFKNSLEIRNLKFDIPIIATAMLAISPWHIYISRLGHEVNAGLAFLVFAMLFFFKKRIYLASLFFTLSFISYHPEKVIIPIFIVSLAILFRKELLEMKKKVLFSILIAVVIAFPFIRETLSPNGLIRLQGTNIFSSNQERFIEQSRLLLKAVESENFFGQVAYNRRVLMASIFLENYVSHFNPFWIFTNPSSDRHKVPEIGLLYLWEAPLIVLGIIFLLFGSFDRRVKILIAVWIFSSPLASSLTTDAPHAMRAYTMLPMPQFLASVGFYKTFRYLYKRKLLLNLGSVMGTFVLGISILTLHNKYFLVFAQEQSSSFQYALSKSIFYVLDNEKSYDKIIFSNKDNLYQSYMFFLFNSRYDPVQYLKQGGTKSGGYDKTHAFGKFEFRPIDQKIEKIEKDTLYIGNPSEFSSDNGSIASFKYLNGVEGIRIVKGG